jgi:hypothetical protein
MILSSGNLAWGLPPRDEKAVRTVACGREQMASARAASALNADLLRNEA